MIAGFMIASSCIMFAIQITFVVVIPSIEDDISSIFSFSQKKLKSDSSRPVNVCVV